jgi:hypothetical protein
MQSEKMIRDSELVLENIVLEENNVKEPVQKKRTCCCKKNNHDDYFWFCWCLLSINESCC